MAVAALPVVEPELPLALPVTLPVILPTNVPFILSLASLNTALLDGYVINISFVPDAQLWALSLPELELASISVLVNVFPEVLYVPLPISKFVPSVHT